MLIPSLFCTQRVWAVKFWQCLLSLPAIVNRDGTRYTKKGEYRTNPDDINANTTDYDFSSGSPSERNTPTGYTIFHTQLPTEYPTQGGDHPSVPNHPEDTSVTSKENGSLCFPVAICLPKHLCSWELGTPMSFVSSLEVGDVIWGGGYGSCQCCLCVDGYCQQFFFNLHLCFSYLGIRSAMSEVFF